MAADDIPSESIDGSKYRVVHCKGALKSYRKSMNGVKAGSRRTFERRLIAQIQRLADGHVMSKENFPQEADLPVSKDGCKRKFNALKKIPIRGYCWKSEAHKDTYFISHYLHKKQNKLDSRDTERVRNNWKRIEENNDEC